MKNQARHEAVKILHAIIVEGAYSTIALRKSLHGSDLSRLDKALITEIVNGTLRNLGRIDWIISKFSKVRIKDISPWVLDIIRCGIYQIIFLDRIPDSAVCNESAELARKYSNEGAVKFVNGILRNISRNKNTIEYPDKNSEPIEYLSIIYSHPKWIVSKWLYDFGMEFTEGLLYANNKNPNFTIRVNRLKINKEELKKILKSENIDYEDGQYNDEALYIKGTSSIEEKESFKKGYYQIQDESSMLTAHILDPKPGEKILDVCSAPGGKTTHIAELMDNKGTILARDVHEHKLKLINDNCRRLGIDIVKTELFNAKDTDERILGQIDRVLVDAPCSGLGIIRRKPDLKWNKVPEDFDKLASMQYDILNTSSQYVKPGGILVYSTCTINKSENNNVIDKFLKTNRGFFLDDITPYLPVSLKNEAKEGFIELYPNVHETDGFFIARLKRIN